MREGEPPGVEFLDAAEPAAGPAAPPELGRPGSRPAARARLAVLAGAGLAVAAVVALTLQTSSGDAPPAAAGTATASGTPAPAHPPGPIGARSVPPLALLPTPRCAVPCVVVDWVADATANAVANSFPGGTVERQMTAFGPGGPSRHPLLAREVTVRAGAVLVVVDVVRLADTRASGSRVQARGDEVHGYATKAGYLIAARVVHGGRHAATLVQRMLDDPGLMSVR
jgi:hypothetical protein